MRLGSNICFLRKQKKYTQEQFAEKMGVTRQTISRWESGEVIPELAKLLEVCDVFTCKLDALVQVKNDTIIYIWYNFGGKGMKRG